MNNGDANRLLLLCATTGYQTRSFVEAARKLGLSVILGTDRCHVLEDPWQDSAWPLRFEEPEESARQIADYARSNGIDAIIALGDRPTSTAARAGRALGLLHHPPEAADACRDKHRSRQRLRAANLKVPAFTRYPLTRDPRELVASGGPTVGFPCVLKPLALSGSRGVVRANNAAQFVAAFERIRALLRRPEIRVMRETTSDFLQVETYVEGPEIAVEGLVDRGKLRVLALFDKPDPLEGPFFEETIYVTPSRLPDDLQTLVATDLDRAVKALGLFHGPLHAELRINSEGVWILEVAARSIGGLCSRALRFSTRSAHQSASLEELIIRLALGLDITAYSREERAAGVMMVPIPEEGIFHDVAGVEDARETPGVEDVVITVKPGQRLVPLPEGSSYLGFIFARGSSPQSVEASLRSAHKRLRFSISATLPVRD